MARFGSQTVTVVVITENLSVRDPFGNPEHIKTPTAVTGCRVRPLTVHEDTTSNGERVTETMKVTAPPIPAIVGLKPTDEIIYDGNTFQVSLARVFPDLGGRPHKAMIEMSRNLG